MRWYINNKEMEDITLIKGSVSNMLSSPNAKQVYTNDWAEYDNLEIAQKEETPHLEPFMFKITCSVAGKSRQETLKKQADFVDLLKQEDFNLKLDNLPPFVCKYITRNIIKMHEHLIVFELTLLEINPRERINQYATPPSKETNFKEGQMSVNGIDVSKFNAMPLGWDTLKGTFEEVKDFIRYNNKFLTPYMLHSNSINIKSNSYRFYIAGANCIYSYLAFLYQLTAHNAIRINDDERMFKGAKVEQIIPNQALIFQIEVM